MQNGPVTIVASYNASLFFKGHRLPGLGETIVADEFQEGAGGKGSNQAICASVLGAATRVVMCLGMDRFGDDAQAMYRSFGIGTDMIRRVPAIYSGIGVILIDRNGDNMISVAPGANFNLCERDIDAAAAVFETSYLVGFQLENRLDVVEYGIRTAHSHGTRTFLDPAPAAKLPDDLFPCIDFIKPNEHEATILSGIAVVDVDSAMRAGKWFLEHGVKTVIVTLGKLGAVCVTHGRQDYYPSHSVPAVDTTGAGDVFSGALMAALSKDKPLDEAMRFANAAAALSVMRLGVIAAIPHLDEVEAFLPAFAEVV